MILKYPLRDEILMKHEIPKHINMIINKMMDWH